MKRMRKIKFLIAFFAMVMAELWVIGFCNSVLAQQINNTAGQVRKSTLQAGSKNYRPTELLLKFEEGTSASEQDRLLKGWGLKKKGDIPQIKVKIISVPEEALDEIKEALSRHPKVKYVEYNYLAEAGVIPNDPNYGSQWHLPKISAPSGWDINVGSSDVAIAIIDSGVNPVHPDLSAKLIVGYNFLAGNTDTHDVLGHGTAVAGCAAALTNNALGIAGVAWNNPIMPLVVLNSSSYASYSDIAKAITYAADRGVKVINISIGGSSSSSTLQNAVNYAWNKGAIIFACAMNNSTNTPYYPAACANVIAVAATGSSDTLASFSDYGDWIDISAPGVSILTTNNGGGYSSWNGTSFSSPISAALAALIFSVNPALSNSQVQDIIEQNTDDLGNPGFDIYYGWGRINVVKALQAAKTTPPPVPDTTPPLTSIISPVNGETVLGGVTISVSASDNVGVNKVELYKDGVLFATDTTELYSFFWDTTKDTNGAYILQSKAYDAAGNIGVSPEVTVYVNNLADTTPPLVTIVQPADGTKLPKKGNVQIAVTASDNIGVTEIDLLLDGKIKHSCFNSTSCVYNLNVNKVSAGTHTITAKAYDAAGNTASANIAVSK